MAVENFKMEQFEKAVLTGNATWWQMQLPSGSVIFGENKAKMLGYSEEMFKTYKDFMKLVHPEDNEKAMQAMRDHMAGKTEVYETIYRIKNKDGKYIKFYDCGQIIKKEGDELTIMGFVMKVLNDQDIFEQMKNFKDLIISGNPSVVDLVAKIK